MEFIQVYDEGVAQYAYIIGCDKTREAVVIDPQRSIDQYIALAESKNLKIVAVTETHIHADFLSGIREFLNRTGVKAYLSEHGKSEGWDYGWVTASDNVEFVKDGSKIKFGEITLEVLSTPGHTPDHIVFTVSEGSAPLPLGVVTGDFVFAGDLGRPDLLERAAKMEGTMKKGAEALFKTVQKFRNQPDSLMIWPGHGAGSACGKSLGSIPYSTWGYEKKTSPALQYNDEQAFMDYITGAQKEPPLYFARMKRLNNKGAPLLSNQKEFKALSALEMKKLAGQVEGLLIIDTRDERSQVMAAHVRGTFYAPFISMSTAVGSMIEDENRPIVLIVDERRSAEAYKRLINLGYDHVIGYITPKTLAVYLEKHAQAEGIAVTSFAAINDEVQAGALTVVDVRSGTEYEAGHIEGAIFAPYTRLPEFLNDLPKGRKLYVHCGSGQRASVAVTYLKERGYDVVLIDDSFANSFVTGATACGAKPVPAGACSAPVAATGTCG